MNLAAVGSFVGFEVDCSSLPDVPDLRAAAMELVREADQIKASSCSLDDPWGYDSCACSQVIPMYLLAVAFLDAYLVYKAEDAKAAFSQKASYVQDVALLLMGGVIAYRRRGMRHRDLDVDDLIRARKLRDISTDVFMQIPDQQRDAAIWFNLGTLLELGGRLDDASNAYRRVLKCEPDSSWSDMARESIQDIRVGNSTCFP